MVSTVHRRSLFEIYCEILEAINERNPIKPTRLMNAVNISWLPLKNCLICLESLDLVKWVNPTVSKKGEIVLTVKGAAFYKGMSNYVNLLSQARDKMRDLN